MEDSNFDVTIINGVAHISDVDTIRLARINIARGVEYRRALASGEIKRYVPDSHAALNRRKAQVRHERPRRSPEARARRTAKLNAKLNASLVAT